METSPTKWHSEPYGFEIIGRERKEKQRGKKRKAYIDALRTVHLVGCESFTVSACLTDNMAKGIHLKHSERADKARSESTQEKHKRKERDDKTTRETTRVHCCKYVLGDNKVQNKKGIQDKEMFGFCQLKSNCL